MKSICPQKQSGRKIENVREGGMRVSGKGIALRVSITNIPRAADAEQQAKLRFCTRACVCVYVLKCVQY